MDNNDVECDVNLDVLDQSPRLNFILFELCPHRRGGGHIVFGADPFGVGVSIGVCVSVTLSCLHDIA